MTHVVLVLTSFMCRGLVGFISVQFVISHHRYVLRLRLRSLSHA
jgi:hypothetical protein